MKKISRTRKENSQNPWLEQRWKCEIGVVCKRKHCKFSKNSFNIEWFILVKIAEYKAEKKTYENVKSDAVSDNDDDEDYNDVDRNKKKLCDADKYYGNSYEKITSINYMTLSIDIY